MANYSALPRSGTWR